MAKKKKPPHRGANILLAGNDPDIPLDFKNDFHKYRGFRELAHGGSGTLLACYDNNLGRTVAIKRLPDGESDDPRQRRRLLREARITAQIQHPNTVPVYEVGRDDQGRLYFAMKKVEGENFFRILGRIAQGDEDTIAAFPLYRVLGIVIQASHALAYAHAHGIVHRDVKPENIMIGLFGEVLLMDWGSARVWGVADDAAEDVEKRVGTPLYMSPEQVGRNKYLDERTDIFSMGVLLYEALAQREPFRGANIHETFDNILNETPPPPSRVAGHFKVTPEMDAICDRALQKNPADRYQSIQAMINEIRAARRRLPDR